MKKQVPYTAFRNRKNNTRGFTLIELIAVIVIISLLVTFSLPAFGKIMEKVETQVCASHLKELGTAVQLAVQDNNGYYPNIEPDPTTPIYLPEDDAETLIKVLEPYGIGPNVLKCPADVKDANYFTMKGTSYEWRPMVDGEPAASPKLIFRRGVIINGTPSRIRLITDFDAVHHGRMNAVFADGHVKVY